MSPAASDAHFGKDGAPAVLSCTAGLWSIELDNGWALRAIGLEILTEERRYLSSSPDCVCIAEVSPDGGSRILCRFPGLTACIQILKVLEHAFVYDCVVTNTGTSDLRIRSISPIDHSPSVYSGGQDLFTVSKHTRVIVCPAERCNGYEGPAGGHTRPTERLERAAPNLAQQCGHALGRLQDCWCVQLDRHRRADTARSG